MIKRFWMQLFLSVLFCTNLLGVETSEDIEKKLHKIVIDAIEKAESQMTQAVQAAYKNQSPEINTQQDLKEQNQFLQEKFGQYWASVDQWLQNINNIQELPQAAIVNKIQALEQKVVQLEREIESFKKLIATSSLSQIDPVV